MNHDHPLWKTAVRVLEDWGMMLVEDSSLENANFEDDTKIYTSEVKMKGTFYGSLAIVAKDDFLKSLASNILGSNDPSEEDKKDAFRELGNILAGNFLTEAYGADLVFDVTQPVVSETSSQWLEQVEGQRVRFYLSADDSPVAVTFSITEKA